MDKAGKRARNGPIVFCMNRKETKNMILERSLRGIAGFFILGTVALAYYHSLYWLWLTAFVGLNLFQSAFTNWCLMMNILKWLGVGGHEGQVCTLKPPTAASGKPS
jgi:hypothetical protein